MVLHEKGCECSVCKKTLMCPKCKSNDFEIGDSTTEADGTEYRELKCKNCGERLVDIKFPKEALLNFDVEEEQENEHPTLTFGQ